MKSKLRTILFVLFAAHLTISCSSDGGNETIDIKDNEITFAFDKLAIIATNDEQIFQMDLNLESETVEETNLTKDFGVEIPYKIFTSDTHVSLLYRQGQKYSFITKRFEKKNVQMHDMLCGFESGQMEAAKSSTVVKDYLLIFTGSGDSFDELSVRSKHLPTGNCQKISFGQGYDFNFNQILYEEDQIVVSFTNISGQYTIAYIDLISGDVSTTTFDKYYSATLNEGMMHMLFYGQTGSIYEVYDPKDWSLVENKEFKSDLNFGYNGLVQTQMYQNKVLIDFQYPQPAPTGNGPGILNLNTGGYDLNAQILSNTKTDLQKKYNANIKIMTYMADLESETLVVGYEVADFKGNISGGLVMSNFEGEILKDISLPYAPLKIVLIE